jgi:hypothetical protein
MGNPYVYDSKLGFEAKQHPTETKCPEQTAAFRDIVDKMYQVHLEKNQDYSPANILGTGEIGIVVRMWDKMTRLMNLLGFEIDVQFANYREPQTPKNESIEDNLRDLAVYAIIHQIYREGKWGR